MFKYKETSTEHIPSLFKSIFFWGAILVAFFLLEACQREKKEAPLLLLSTPQMMEQDSIAQTLHTKGVGLDDSGKWEDAIVQYDQALSIRTSLIPHLRDLTNDTLKEEVLEGIVKAFQNKSNCYHALQQFDVSEKTADTCLIWHEQIEKEWGFSWKDRRGKAYHRLGQINSKHKVERAYSCYRLAANYFLESEQIERYRNVLIDLSDVFNNLLEADSISFYAGEAIAVSNANCFFDVNLAKAWINYGAACDLKKLSEKAIAAYDSALHIISEDSVNFNDISICYHNQAHSNFVAGNLNEALRFANIAIMRNNSQHTSAEDRYRLAGNHTVKGDILRNFKKNKEALSNYDKAIALYGNYSGGYVSLNRMNVAAISSTYQDDLLEAVHGKAQTLLSLNQRDEALAYYDTAIYLSNKYRVLLSDEASKLKFAELSRKIFEGAIEACLQNPDPENTIRAFQYAEGGKAFTLLETVLHLKAMGKAPGIAKEDREKESRLRQEIEVLSQKYTLADASQEQDLLLKINQAQTEWDALQAKFQANEAYQKLIDFSLPNIETIQNSLLKQNQGLVEYFVGERQSYVFYLPPQGNIEVHPFPLGREKLKQKIDSLVMIGIRLPYTEIADIQDPDIQKLKQALGGKIHAYCDTLYAHYAFELYQLLLAPLQKTRQAKPDRLMVIPDDVLGYLPFDVLLTQTPTDIGHYRDYDYAGGETGFQLSYCYSTALLKEMQSRKHTGEAHQLLAFSFNSESAFRNQTVNLKSLFAAPWDVLYNGFRIVETKKDLLAQIKAARFLHFSTHGKMNDRNSNYSYLLMDPNTNKLEDSLFYLYEVYGHYPLNADMVVTSACETGIGKLYRGEGIISLARGFSAAGASSIITTLWAVDATDSGDLLKLFYKELQKGLSKDQALSNAKTVWVQERAYDQEAKPYFWAGIVPVGDMQAVDLPATGSGFWTIALFAAGVVLLLWLFRKTRARLHRI